MATVASMIYSIEAQTSSMEKSMASVKTLVESAESSMISSIATASALGGALDKLGGMAMSLFMDVAEAIPGLIEHTVEFGNQLFEMSMKTGASVENLSALKYVAAETGMNFDTLTTSFFKVETALGSTGPKADTLSASLHNVGLSMQDLKNERPDEAFISIVSALENVGNAADRNALAMQLFGRGAKDMAGLFHGNITQMIQDAQDLGLVMSTGQAAAAHAASVGWESFTMQLEAAGNRIAETVLPGLVAIESLLSGSFKAGMDSAGQATIDMSGFVVGATEDVLALGNVAVQAAHVAYDAFVQLGPLFDMIVSSISSFVVNALEQLKGFAAVASLIPGVGDAFKGLAGAIDTVRTGTIDAVEHLNGLGHAFLDGKSTGDQYFNTLSAGLDSLRVNFPLAYDAAVAKIKQFADESKSAGATIASSLTIDPKTLEAQLAATEKLYDEYYKVLNAGSHDHVAAEINDAYLAADAQIAAMEKNKTITLADYDIIWAKAEATADNIIQKTLESDSYTREHYALIADQARIAYDFALDHLTSYTNQEIQQLHDAYVVSEQASNHWAATAAADMDKVASKGQATAQAVASSASAAVESMSMADAAFDEGISSAIKNVQTLAGEWITAADAKKRFDTTSSMTYDLSSDLGIQMFEKLNPGAALNISTDQIESFIKGGGTLQQLIDGGAINLYAGLEATNGAPTGRTAPHFAAGGPVPSDGLIYAHAGEYVVPKSGALIGGSGGGASIVVNTTVNLSALTPGDARVSEQLRQTVDKVMVDLLKTRVHLGSN